MMNPKSAKSNGGWSGRPCSASIQPLPRVGAHFSGLVGHLGPDPGVRGGWGSGRPSTPVWRVPIEYPLDLWDAEVEGETLLRVRVTETGGVDSVEVIEASGYPAFDSAAVRGAFKLRYSPARRNGNRITVWARSRSTSQREGASPFSHPPGPFLEIDIG